MIGTPITGLEYQYRHLQLDTCDSTNTQCMHYAKLGEPSHLWVTAESQEAGKGSRGRDWVSDKGNLFASLMLRNPAELKYLYQLTFVTAVSLSAAISTFAQHHLIAHKWPNDILITQKKCSGILLESTTYDGDICVVIGIGVNCLSFPTSTMHPATSLKHEGISCSVNDLFKGIAIEMAEHISLWNKGNNFSAIRNLWLEKAHGVNEKVCIKIPDKPDSEGIFRTIDKDGLLQIELPDGNFKKISTADIFFKDADTSVRRQV